MKFLFTLLLSTAFLVGQTHEGHQAFYKLSVENGTLILATKLEIPDVKQCVKNESKCATEQDFNWCAGTWLIDQISISIDGKIRSLTLESSYTEDGHLHFKYLLGKYSEKIQQLDITNVAFIQTIADYENIFQVDVKEEKQGYKMNKDRTEVSINLKQKP